MLIANARILDPSCEPPVDFIGDILIEGDRIIKVGSNLAQTKIAQGAQHIDASGLCAAPGFLDIHVHLRDPGFTHKEDIITGCKAAAAGGVTGVCCMPNTKPVTDSEEVLSYILDKAKDADARVYPIASITKGMLGQELNDIAALHACGAVAVSDDGRPVENGGMMLKALKEAYKAGVPVISHCEDLTIIDGGIINEGRISKELGVKGMDRASEDSITAREIVLAESSDTAIHIAHVSTKGSVQLIREAKARGVKVTCETAPHYMMMTDELLLSYNANFRMNPPLREQEDCEAIVEGVLDGTIDAIVTDHAPHAAEEKANFLKAPNGIVGLETSFAAACTVLVHQCGMSLLDLVKLMSTNPANLLRLPGGTLREGSLADIVLFDPDRSWTVDAEKLHSKSKNTPFDGLELTGRVVRTILGGKTVFEL
ncbi:MAG: dihydroorotase [Negativibacillus massiliensis]|uniref:dihydroorotase n=1 Tax=Negativibacillus massiliensis TaxID=1871035 RepID=UPI000976D17C|nr:dihydroorotase [Negativibacillus massiliensis]MBS5138431.1 dihydroorotase [Clostridium sp.]MCI6347408.1 dihydroorotase [Negativibacillus massiliensis]